VEDWRSACDGLVYVNPPYSQARAWLAKCATESAEGIEIIALVPARTDTRAWHESIWRYADAVCFWRGRLRFVGATASAPFPSAVVYYGHRAERFRAVFGQAGRVVRL
jgi:site-specific DNA-methyltransferase (adenine-specific)